jgi:hypothetical protein
MKYLFTIIVTGLLVTTTAGVGGELSSAQSLSKEVGSILFTPASFSPVPLNRPSTFWRQIACTADKQTCNQDSDCCSYCCSDFNGVNVCNSKETCGR